MGKVWAVIACLLAGTALAGSAVVRWAHPTTRTDGSALPATDITGTQLEWGTCAGPDFGVVLGQLVVAPNLTGAIVPNLSAGLWCFRLYTLTAAGRSDPSSTGRKQILDGCTPGCHT